MHQDEHENANQNFEDTEEAVKQVFVNLVSETPPEAYVEAPEKEEIPSEAVSVEAEVLTEIKDEPDMVAPQEESPREEPTSAPVEITMTQEPQDTAKESGKDAQRNWYVIHTYSGYENKVRDNLIKRIETMNMRDKIFQVLVPTEEEVEFKDGKKKTVQKKIYPGYVLVEMIMSDNSWYVVRNTPGVTGFVGPSVKPTPVRGDEIKQILRIMGMEPGTKIKISVEKGQGVRVKSGPFKDFTGIIEEIYPEREKLKVLIFIFGRETPVELDFRQIEKL